MLIKNSNNSNSDDNDFKELAQILLKNLRQ